MAPEMRNIVGNSVVKGKYGTYNNISFHNQHDVECRLCRY
jgi:hypothetical protein